MLHQQAAHLGVWRYAGRMESDAQIELRQTLSGEVRAWLGRRNVSQAGLARELGLNPSAVSRRLRGDVDFTLWELAQIADWLEISLADLLGPDILTAREADGAQLVGVGAQKKARPVRSDQSGLRGCAPRDLNPEPID